MEQTETQLDEDEERFHKLQMTDAANFNDKLDSLSVSSKNFNEFWKLLFHHLV